MSNITILTSNTPDLRKTFNSTGQTAAGRISSGYYQTWNTDINNLGNWLQNVAPNQCLCLGSSQRESGHICTTNQYSGEIDPIPRTDQHFQFRGGDAWMMLDIDGQSPDAVERLFSVIPGISSCGYIIKPSSNPNPDKYSWHVYIQVIDGTDIPAFMKRLGRLLWISGMGHIFISKTGGCHVRSLIDESVGSPERIIYEAEPELLDGITKPVRETIIHDGPVFDTHCVPELNTIMSSLYDTMVSAAITAAESEAATVRHEYHKRTGIPEYVQDEILKDDDVLYFGRNTPVRMIDIDASYNDRTVCDPLEPEYNGWHSTVAKIWVDDSGSVTVRSNAHGMGKLYKYQGLMLRSAGFGVGVELPATASVKSPVDIVMSQLSYSQLNTPEEWFSLVAGGNFGVVDLDTIITRLGEHPMVEGGKRVIRKEYEQRIIDYNNQLIQDQALEAGRHVIQWSPRKINEAMNTTEHALIGVNGSLEYFLYAGRLSYTVETEPKTNKRNGLPPKHHLIKQYSRNTLTQRIEDSAEYVSTNKSGETVKIGVPKDMVGHMIENPLSNAPIVQGLVRHPVLTYDGRLICEEGIDNETGLLFKFGGHIFGDVKTCDRSGAASYVESIRNSLFSEFTYIDNGKGHVASIGMLMSVLQRKVIDDCPGFMINANCGSTGKSTNVDMINIIATGKLAAPLSFSSSRSEMEKASLASLMESPNMLFYDNVSDGKEVSSDILSVLITQNSYKGRILGVSEMVEVPTNMVVVITGNNISTSTDLAPRFVKISLTSLDEDPTHKEYKDNLIIKKCLSVRNHVITSILSILKGYIDAGRPDVLSHSSRFTDWDTMVRAPLMWATGVDIEDNIAINREDSGEFQATEGLMHCLRAMFGDQPFTSMHVINKLDTGIFESLDPNMSSQSIKDGMKEHLDTLNYGKEIKGATTISWVLKKMIGKNIKGYKIEKQKTKLAMNYKIVTL